MDSALPLHPIYALPVDGEFEQVLNALYLEKLGSGMYTKQLSQQAR
jgi:hypothetical protein